MASPIPTYKVDFVFNALGGGWSETFYYTTGNTMKSVLDDAVKIAPARIGCLGDAATMDEIRVSDVNIQGDSLVNNTVSQTWRAPVGPSDILNVCVYARLEASSRHRRIYAIRGCPDEWVTGLGQLGAITTDGTKAINNWLSQIAFPTNPYQLRCSARPAEDIFGSIPAGPVQVTPLVTITTGGLSNVTTDIGFAPPGGVIPLLQQKIQVRGCRKSLSALNGVWNIIGIGDNTYTISLPFALITGYRAQDYQNATVNFLTIGYVGLTSANIEKVGTKKTGKGFFAPRGRQRRKGR